KTALPPWMLPQFHLAVEIGSPCTTRRLPSSVTKRALGVQNAATPPGKHPTPAGFQAVSESVFDVDASLRI
ncbi:unnamed protein product, partial [Polarella glacialis]